MDFEKICMMFSMQEPFYGILLSSMQRIPKREVGTMGIGMSGNVFRLYYNPDFVKPLPIDTVLELLKHEVLHVAFCHPTLWEERDVPKEIHEIRNWAADMEVNSYLNENNLRIVHPVLPENFGWPKRLGAREYYNRLSKLVNTAKQKYQAKMTVKACNGGTGGKTQNMQATGQKQDSDKSRQQRATQNKQPSSQQQSFGNESKDAFDAAVEEVLGQFEKIDTHEDWPDETPEEMNQIQQIIDDMIDFAAAEVEKACGDIPGEMKGKVEMLRKKPKPAADWKRYFRRYLGNEFSEFIRKSKKRESRRFPDAAGNRHRRKSHILVAIDTSGSVSMPEYTEFMGQIKTLTQTADFHVIECDAIIQHEYDYTGKPNLILHGGGGTSFEPVVNRFIAERRKYDALVYFTDGYCNVPSNTPKDTLWVISSKGVKDRKPFQINGASCVLIPPQQQ